MFERVSEDKLSKTVRRGVLMVVIVPNMGEIGNV